MAQQRPFRFLHASDLLLGKPVQGVEDLPAHLMKRMVDAPGIAAERLFDLAVEEKVDFVILSGEMINCYRTGPWGPVFLVSQFQKLSKANIPVYWATGKADAQNHWPSELELPENVTVFPVGQVGDVLFQKDGFAVTRILGTSRSHSRRHLRSSEFHPDNTGLYTIAVVPEKVKPSILNNRGIDYWALGNRKKRYTYHGNSIARLKKSDKPEKTARSKKVREEFVRPSLVHDPGTMLARSFRQTGSFGASLVVVDAKGKTTISLIPLSPVRFVSEEIRLDSTAGLHQLREEIRHRMITFQSVQDQYDLLIRWSIDGSQELENQLRKTNALDQLCEELRHEYGMDEPYGWTVSVKTVVPENFPPEYYDEETLLGDYLRKVREFQTEEKELPSLEALIPPEESVKAVAEKLLRGDPKTRDDFLRDVAELGVDLLMPEVSE